MADPDVERPTGRDDVRAAVLEAAAERFAAEGPDASLRAIADDAGVNLGLIHRHVGNKDDLLRAVLAREIEGGAGSIERAGDAAAALRNIFLGAATDGRYIRIVAWLLLHDPTGLRHQDRYPGMAALRSLGDVDDAQLMMAMAAIYGWTVFGPQLRTAFGHDDSDGAELDAQLVAVLEQMVGPTRSRAPIRSRARGRSASAPASS